MNLIFCRFSTAVFAAVTLVATQIGHAADFPSQPIRLIVPQAPGALVDPVARVIGQALSIKLGQPVIVENRTGAGGAIATAFVAKSNPDGHTLLVHSSGLVTNAATQRENPGYDILKDLTPIVRVASAPFLVCVNPASPIKSIPDLLAYARANPKKLNFGSSGPGSSNHLAIEVLKRAAGIDMTHIPYKGGAQQTAALLGREIDFTFDTIGSSGELVRSGKLRALATTGPRRSTAFPDLPTIGESGVPGYEADFWVGVFAAAGTQPAIIEKLSVAIKEVMVQPAVRAKLTELSLEGSPGDPSEFAKQVRSDLEKWTKVAAQLGNLN